jgi:glutathione peroxidase-family protein
MHQFLKIYFGVEFYMFPTVSVYHQESSTVYTAIGMCHTGYADC